MPIDSLRIGLLAELYSQGQLNLEALVAEIYALIAAQGDDDVWVQLVPERESLAAARSFPDGALPLFGIPFAVKDSTKRSDPAAIPSGEHFGRFGRVAESLFTSSQLFLLKKE